MVNSLLAGFEDFMWIIWLVVGIVVVISVIVLISSIVNIYNRLVRLKNAVEEAWATIDVHLKKRYDLIPNLVETVKGFAKHESGTLEAVIKARQVAMSAGTPDAKMEAENALSGTLKSLFAMKLEERYPDLKANANFMDLMNQLKHIEEEIASSRRYYNGTVKAYNTQIEIFPSNIFAGMFNFQRRPYFEVTEPEEREAPKVQF